MDPVKLLKKHWKWIALILIFFLALDIRLLTAGDKWLQAYDPYFHYRYTENIVEHGYLPAWDDMSYYPPGRPFNHPPLMHYVTAYLFMIFGSSLSLMAFVKYMAAIYGTLMVIPAFLLGRELAGEKAGLISSFFIGISPAILTRTMAGFFDTDGLVIFFTLLTIYLLIRVVKKNSYINWGLASIGLILFALTWGQAWYVPIIVLTGVFVYGFLSIFIENIKKPKKIFKNNFLPILGIFLGSGIITLVLGYNPFNVIINMITLLFSPSSVQIVNISVAELQQSPGWIGLFSKVSMSLIFLIGGSLLLLKRRLDYGIIFLTWTVVTLAAVMTGVRFILIFAPAAATGAGIFFAELYRRLDKLGDFSPLIGLGIVASAALALASPLAAFLPPTIAATILATIITVVILYLIQYKNWKGGATKFSKSLILGVVIFAGLIALSQGTQVANQYSKGSPMGAKWEEAYMWLKNNTPKDSVVGTWWDPGHRIAAVADRHNIADGAHCSKRDCDPGLNTRITHLGKIFATDNVTEAENLLLKYRGNASEMYWIVSDDLIGKFRWLQYFGTGCDGTGRYTAGGQQKCPLYSQYPVKNQGQGRINYRGGISLVNKNGTLTPVVQTQTGEITLRNMIIHRNGKPMEVQFEGNRTISGTVWVHPNFSYLVYIPKNLKDSTFTRMFFYEEEKIGDFELAFDNNKIKIYKLGI